MILQQWIGTAIGGLDFGVHQNTCYHHFVLLLMQHADKCIKAVASSSTAAVVHPSKLLCTLQSCILKLVESVPVNMFGHIKALQ